MGHPSHPDQNPVPEPSSRFSSIYSTPSLISSVDSEDALIKKEVEWLYQSAELPSIFGPGKACPELAFSNVRGETGEDRKSRGTARNDEPDPASARNWTAWKKSVNIGCIFLMCVLSPFTSSVIGPAIPNLMTDLRSNDTYLAGFVLSIFVLGYAVGPLLISPLSELYGRVPLYHICNILFTLCTLFAGRATNPQVLATLRFFAGVGGSSVFALAPSSLADMVAREKRGAALAFIAIGYNLGPALAPTAGSYVNDAWGWRWIFYVTGILGAGVTVLNAVCLSESYEPVLLRRKNACSPIHVDTVAAFRKAMFMPTYMLFSSPSIFLVSLLTAVGYGYVYILYTTLPTTILTSYAWAPKRIGLAYLGTAVGNFFGMVAAGCISDAIMRQRAKKGNTLPENRLLPMVFFWPLVSIGLFVYAWTAQNKVHWLAPLIGTAIFSAGAMSTIFFASTYILDAYPTHSASGIAASSLLRALVGGLAPLFSNRLVQKLEVGWAFSLLAFIALAFAPVPWISYRFGERWRTREKMNVRVEGEKV